jgi:hypothetical protein
LAALPTSKGRKMVHTLATLGLAGVGGEIEYVFCNRAKR